MSQLVLSDLRRLYHHVENGGTWDYAIDNRRLSVAISTIEELSEGGCRNNCTTGKQQYLDGYVAAVVECAGFEPDGIEAEAEASWKSTNGNKQG